MTALRNSALATIIFLNLVLLLFLWERQTVVIPNDVPSIAEMKSARSEIITESLGSSRHGNYIVEDFREVQVWYDNQDRIVKRVPTGNHTYLRYWASKNGKVIIDDSDMD